MKRISQSAVLSFCLLVLTAFTAMPASGQESSYQVETTPFTLVILGTRNAGDVEVIRRNIARLPYVKKFLPFFESQKHIEFFGGMVGSIDTLVADIRSLAADRYEFESRDDKQRGLVITLRKIQPQ